MWLPRVSNTGMARANADLLPPAIIVNLPSIAPISTARHGRVDVVAALRHDRLWLCVFVTSRSVVPISITSMPGVTLSSRPSAPAITASTAGESRTITIVMSPTASFGAAVCRHAFGRKLVEGLRRAVVERRVSAPAERKGYGPSAFPSGQGR